MHQEAGSHSRCLNWVRTKLCWCCYCLCLLGGLRKDVCIICAKLLSSSTRVQCDTAGCKGVCCPVCFSESNNKCCLCKRPIDYGDYSDISEPQDSSDDPTADSFYQLQKRLYCGNTRRKEREKES